MKFTCFFKYKKLITNIFIYIIIFYLLMNSKIILGSISQSTSLFITKLIPALLPYLLITELLIHSGKARELSYGIDVIISKFFRIPKHTSSVVIIGFLLGYPNSAKYISKLYADKLVDRKLATKLVSFTSNANMSYILSAIGIGMFNSIQIGLVLAVSHFLSAFIIGILLGFSYNNIIIQQTNTISNSFKKIYSPFELLYTSIFGSLKTLALIFSYTVIFSLIPNLIFCNLNANETLKAIIIGTFEISNGINSINALNISFNLKLLLTSFVLSFSSIMILFQIYSFVFKAKVKFKDLLLSKLLQGILSAIITYVIIHYIYSPAVPAFLNQDSFIYSIFIRPSTIYMFAICITIFLSCILFRKSDKNKLVA